jgi:predicted nucleic acid-binding protein
MRRIREVGEAQICTSIIVAVEPRYGAAKRALPPLTAQFEAVLGALEVLPFELPADAAYDLIRSRLEGASRPIGVKPPLLHHPKGHDPLYLSGSLSPKFRISPHFP